MTEDSILSSNSAGFGRGTEIMFYLCSEKHDFVLYVGLSVTQTGTTKRCGTVGWGCGDVSVFAAGEIVWNSTSCSVFYNMFDFL